MKKSRFTIEQIIGFIKQAVGETAPAPVVGAAAGFHGDHGSGRDLRQAGGQGVAPQIAPLPDPAGAIGNPPRN